MTRAIKVSLNLLTQAKQNRLAATLGELRSCTNAYIRSLWKEQGDLSKATLNRFVGGSLGYDQRASCLKQALEVVAGTRESARVTGKHARMPVIKGNLTLSCNIANVEKGKKSFDYVIKVSSLSSGNRIVIPIKSHKRLNHWIALGGTLLQGCTINSRFAVIWLKVPVQVKETQTELLAVDTGYCKLFTDQNDKRYGTRIKELCENVRRCKPGSAGKRKARKHRDDYINESVRSLPWNSIKAIAVENLVNLKKGKKKDRSKSFRKKMAPWTYRKGLQRIEQLAEENRVRLYAVNPRNTSRTCPRCGLVAKANRVGERFSCVSKNCNFVGDADHVGAQNIFALAFRKPRGAVYDPSISKRKGCVNGT